MVDETVYDEPVAEEPVYDEPVTEEPVYDEPVVDETVYDEPVAEEPVYDEPVTEEPVYDEPVYDEPVYEEPAYDGGGDGGGGCYFDDEGNEICGLMPPPRPRRGLVDAPRAAYIPPVRGDPDYGDKRTCNRRLGPGGGTRGSTKPLALQGNRGRNRIDGRSKRPAFAR